MRMGIITPPEWRAPLSGYLAHLSSIKRPASTQKLRSYHLRRFAASTGLTPRLTTHDDLVVYLGSNAWAPGTVHSVRSTLRSFYQWAHVVARIVDDDPTTLLEAPDVEQGLPRPADYDAIAAAIAGADERIRLMLELASTMGLRCCEICKVHTGDVFEHRVDGLQLRIAGKGRRKRDVPLSPQVRTRLAGREPGFLFAGAVDGHLSASYVSKLVSRALPEGVTAHMLRHAFATTAYGAERDLRAVQKLLGHASIATTEIYTFVPSPAKLAGVAAAAMAVPMSYDMS